MPSKQAIAAARGVMGFAGLYAKPDLGYTEKNTERDKLKIATIIDTHFADVVQQRDDLLAVLREIAETPHQTYGHKQGSGEYAVGVADGHRCAAKTAKNAIAKVEESK